MIKFIKTICVSLLFTAIVSIAIPESDSLQISDPNHLPLPMNNRTLGLAISDNKQVTYDQACNALVKMGANFTEFSIHWDDIEKSKETYSFEWFDIINVYFKEKNIKIGLSIGAIDMVSDRRPKDLLDLPINSEIVINRYNNMIKQVLSRMPDIDILYVSVSNEISSHFKTEQDFENYSIFEKQTSKFIRGINPNTLTGTKNMFSALTGPQKDILAEVNKNKKYIFVNYYPLKPDFSFKTPSVIHQDIQTLKQQYPNTKIYFTEIGYASGTNIASEQLQSLFFQEMFIAWDNNKDLIPLMNIDWLLDKEPQALDNSRKLFGNVNNNFYEYLATLGLANKDGSKKPAYYTIQKEVSKRN